jgi:hypothetical protein
MAFVCEQPSVTSSSRRTEDLTMDKTDEKDAVLIARLTAQLRCYEPEPTDETWARLRHLGTRREQLVSQTSGQIQQMRDLLDCVWPAVLDTAQQPFRSQTWIAALSVVLERDGGELARTRRLGWARFQTAVRKHITKQGRQKPCLRIARRVFTALTDPAGVHPHRAGALERVALLLQDLDPRARPTRRHRDPNAERARRAAADRAGHLDHRVIRRGRGGDLGRDR